MAKAGSIEIAKGNTPSNTTRARVRDIAKMIVKGKTRDSIIEATEEKYELSLEQSRKLYNAAMKYLQPREEEIRDQLQGKLYARYEDLYEKAVEARNLKVAREILDSIAKLAGMVQKNSVEIDKGEEKITISFD